MSADEVSVLPRRAPAPGLFAVSIRRLDRLLRERQGIFEFSDDPRNLLRAAFIPCPEAIELADHTRLSPGDILCDLHLFNERLPQLSRRGATISWAAEANRRLRYSLGELAEAVLKDSRFDQVVAIHAVTSFVTHGGGEKLSRMARRLHFEMIDPTAPRTPLGRLHDFAENILVWSLVKTFNPGGMANARFIRERHRFFISRQALLENYGRRRGQALSDDTPT